VAAAINLDIGIAWSSTTALYAAWSLLPLGSLAFRIALAKRSRRARCPLLFARATRRATLGLSSRTLSAIALLGAWLACWACDWFQAIRPEVYALQACLLFLAMERLAQFVSRKRATTPALPSGIRGRLGLTNHT